MYSVLSQICYLIKSLMFQSVPPKLARYLANNFPLLAALVGVKLRI